MNLEYADDIQSTAVKGLLKERRRQADTEKWEERVKQCACSYSYTGVKQPGAAHTDKLNLASSNMSSTSGLPKLGSRGLNAAPNIL